MTELKLPPVGIGTHKISQESLEAALELGFRHIDLATAYGNLSLTARAIRNSSIGREDLILTLKILPDDIENGVDQALEELNTDYIDCLLLHTPYADLRKCDRFLKPLIGENMAVRHFGVSNFSSEDLIRMQKMALKPEFNQIEIHPYYYPDTVIETGRGMHVHPVAYRPLGGGKTELLKDPAILGVADKWGVSPGQVPIAWLKAQGIPCIVKSEKKEHLKENLLAATLSLDAEDMALIGSAARQNQRTCTSWMQTEKGRRDEQ